VERSEADRGASGLAPGAVAPELGLPATPDGRFIQLADFRGTPVVLVFYPADFTPVCGSELALFNEILPDIDALGGKLLAISCDSVWSHLAFAERMNLKMPLLSDFHPKGEASRRYRVYDDAAGVSARALFVVDSAGVVFWREVVPGDVNPGAAGVLDALERLRSPRPAKRGEG
jgi:peroxiredoxin (alkyl hydroperoxide reductase subunit C)